ncbi:MAG: carbamoyltransferase HypF [Nitrospira bacterium SG8_3]|nr:MAG: carbamoyltransferase HypF [Nitrospira bacterium SG8_3]
MIRRSKGAIKGIVQGVGFRPFIYQLAHRYQLSGHVVNTPEGVDLEVEGPDENVEHFFQSLLSESPPLAHISSMERAELRPKNDKFFEIQESRADQERSALISPDMSICSDCLRELKDSKDRRFRYPFINCTNCGPRYTIIMDIPYDRAMTTMKKFKMCKTCQREYEDPTNRRFHAQPNACWDCGPRLSLHDHDGLPIDRDTPIEKTIHLLKRGSILAIKGLGGFHLAVDATNHKAVVRLRKRKHREEKPLAIMVRDLEAAKEIAHINEIEATSLLSPQRPILILKKRRFHRLSPQVAPRNRYFGIMLPYTPLHYLLMDSPFSALVMTSGNISEEPINIDNEDAFKNLKRIADYFLVHDRDIYLRSDDSIIRMVGRVPRQVRRSRGYVPIPVFLPEEMSELPSVLAVGGELKNTICITKENRAFLSQHVGDMENLETFDFFRLTISHMESILEIRPKVMAHDLHPDYLSSKFGREQEEIPALAVQHHHAHIVSCLAENGVKAPVIGLALDGTGFGSDGEVWGGEILLADLNSFQRAAHLDYVSLPGGDAAAKFPWRMALSYLHKTYGEELFNLPIKFVRDLKREDANIVFQMITKGVNSPLTSSCGRLFDAISSLIGLRQKIAYEGQAAMELEMRQNLREKGKYPWAIEEKKGHLILLTSDIIKSAVEDIKAGISRGIISRRFHNTLIDMFTGTCIRLREASGIDHVAMSGGAFQNVTLLNGLSRSLTSKGFKVFTQKVVPSNDGGLSLGQAVCAGLRYMGVKGKFES